MKKDTKKNNETTPTEDGESIVEGVDRIMKEAAKKKAAQKATSDTLPIYDSGSVGWTLLGIFADPIWAFVVYLCWKDYRPKTAKKALIGAIIGLIIRVIFAILIISAFVSLYNSAINEYEALLSQYAALY